MVAWCCLFPRKPAALVSSRQGREGTVYDVEHYKEEKEKMKTKKKETQTATHIFFHIIFNSLEI